MKKTAEAAVFYFASRLSSLGVLTFLIRYRARGLACRLAGSLTFSATCGAG